MKKWEINRVSTPERIFEKIKEEMARPVGIILFGADCNFKNEAVKDLQIGLSDAAKTFYGAPSTHEMVELVHSSAVSLFVLNSMESTDRELRHECIKVMRRTGVKTVVGVYVKVKKPWPLLGRNFIGRPDLQLLKTTVRKLLQNPPTADEVDYLIIVK